MGKVFIDKLVSLMDTAGMDAVMVCPSEELKLLIGFSPSMCERFQGLFIGSGGRLFYLCNLIYDGEMKNAVKDIDVYSWHDGEVMADSVHKILERERLTGKKIGVNSSAPAFSALEIAAKSQITFVNARPLLEEARIIKTGAELESLRISSSITDKAFNDVIKFIKPGMREGDIKDFLFSAMKKYGGDRPGAIVASGPNSSFPHYHGTERVIEERDVILLDFGCTYNDMFSDISRTLFTGGVTDEQANVYEICRKSTETGEAACFEGAFIPDIDRAARAVIDAAGYGEFFINRLGHGVGYMGHEAPDIKASNPRKLEKGMCFSIEPGINLPGKYGMRVEDVVAITENGTEILNKSTHDMIII